MGFSIGVDIGGTKIAAVIVDEQGVILYRSKVSSNTNNAESMFKQVVTCIDQVLKKANLSISQIKAMGVGVPGKVDRLNGIAVYQNNLPWIDFPLVNRLREAFSIHHIVIDNDVYMAAYAEWKKLNVAPNSTCVYVTISTGISCSIIQNGSFLRGEGFAGEIGLCPITGVDGQLTTLENAASGPAIYKLARERMGNSITSTQDFFQAYIAGDKLASDVMDEVIPAISQGIYSIISLLDPHQIVLGGGVINHHPFLLDLIKQNIGLFLISEQKEALGRITGSKLKGDSGVIGAALCSWENVMCSNTTPEQNFTF
ncbi:ROK family protein [Virgibacillus sp. AGTR]|uniref:ROK family protein n=1 Tax=Virgibacillus sp. AGTR TaxID=2812055 RepID=UPI0019640DD2|nr:ROK family protein [Virgibacillus sp. AGTR]MCC2248627.1 ROK family protein [Virgibacillus sp. AGTR]QRZ18382.1 ROK family protein [Virgibacillus sp. AGTR]